jgi:diacylglycerol kinase (ATP)
MANSSQGLERLVKAFGYSMKGFLLPFTPWLARDLFDAAVLVSSLLLLLITELFNSAIEALTDRVGTEHHELSGRAKDLASAAVFLALVLVAATWGALAWLRFTA